MCCCGLASRKSRQKRLLYSWNAFSCHIYNEHVLWKYRIPLWIACLNEMSRLKNQRILTVFFIGITNKHTVLGFNFVIAYGAEKSFFVQCYHLFSLLYIKSFFACFSFNVGVIMLTATKACCIYLDPVTGNEETRHDMSGGDDEVRVSKGMVVLWGRFHYACNIPKSKFPWFLSVMILKVIIPFIPVLKI